jgi:hypothetical protein
MTLGQLDGQTCIGTTLIHLQIHYELICLHSCSMEFSLCQSSLEGTTV